MRHSVLLSVVLLTAALAAPARAGDLVGIDATTSTVMQEGQSSFSGLGLRLRFHPATLIRNVEIMPTIEYWRNASSLSAFNIESSRKDATLGVDARYVFYKDGWEPYVGAGYAVHFLSSSVNAPSLNLNERDQLVHQGRPRCARGRVGAAHHEGAQLLRGEVPPRHAEPAAEAELGHLLQPLGSSALRCADERRSRGGARKR